MCLVWMGLKGLEDPAADVETHDHQANGEASSPQIPDHRGAYGLAGGLGIY